VNREKKVKRNDLPALGGKGNWPKKEDKACKSRGEKARISGKGTKQKESGIGAGNCGVKWGTILDGGNVLFRKKEEV